LLDILAGRKDQSGLSGQVLINGSPPPANFKRISGYVVQVRITLRNTSTAYNILVVLLVVVRFNKYPQFLPHDSFSEVCYYRSQVLFISQQQWL